MQNFKLYKRLKEGGYMYITCLECETLYDAIEHFKDTKMSLVTFNECYCVTTNSLN